MVSLYAYSLGYDKQCNTVSPCDATCMFDFVLFSTTRLDFAIPLSHTTAIAPCFRAELCLVKVY